MTYEFISDQPPEIYPAPGSIDKSVLLNPHKLKFLILVEPSLEELAEAVEQHAFKRLEDRWSELMQASNKGPLIRALQVKEIGLRAFSLDQIIQLSGETQLVQIAKKFRRMSLGEQRDFIAQIKPKTIGEMLALYLDTSSIDQTGYRYFQHELGKAKSARDFFGNLTTALFTGFASTDYKLGSPKPSFHQPRIFEFLGMAAKRGWILFPFITGESGTNEIRALMHKDNTRRYLNPVFGPQQHVPILEMLSGLAKNDTEYSFSHKYAKYLTVCSTFKNIGQASTALFNRCAELVDNGKPDSHRQIGYARRCYNAMLLLHNSHFASAPRQAQITKNRPKISLDEFSSLSDSVVEHPHLAGWAKQLSAFIRDNPNAPGSGLQRKSYCVEFLDFLVSLPTPPLHPLDTQRSHINDFTEGGPCFRNYLRREIKTPDGCNSRLQQMSQFFSFIQDRQRVEFKGGLHEAKWFANPIDMRRDRFNVELRSGTTRKSISADILETMRKLLIEDDYAWAKQWDCDWAHLVNQETKRLEYVWCPSAALCLYTLLSLPLRSLQARMFDSGEGDAVIYDFDSGRMLPNPNQLPVNGRIDPNRREGFLQVMPSGLASDPELLGLWICVNKTSDEGYAIPWISDDLLHHLRYQREWIQRYAPHPNTQTIEDAQGHRNTPQEWIDSQNRFYCLFRDPAVIDRVSDKSFPVSKQKLGKIWGRLSFAVQERLNALASEDKNRVTLARFGSKRDTDPIALHDLHSLRVSGITDLLDRGVPLNIVSEYVAGHATYIMTLWYDSPAPGSVRRAMMQAHERAGESLGPLPRLLDSEIAEMKPFLISHPDHEGMYTGFDALQENTGLIHVRHSGICPGTRCEEGGLTSKGRIDPVPVGDRGPSCPQCRFWLTGPAFLLGQVIEGNQLIMKIRKKVDSLASCRQKIMDAEDANDTALADLLRGKNDVEERQLNNMLAEWWHRMRFYESSIAKLDAYRKARDTKESAQGTEPIVLFRRQDKGDPHFGYGSATELELKHFLSTCSEILPAFTDEGLSAHQDIELAVGRFLAVNDEQELSSMFFKLDEAQRLAAANLAIELLQRASASPMDTNALLEGKIKLKNLPHLQGDLKSLLSGGVNKAMVGAKRRLTQGSE